MKEDFTDRLLDSALKRYSSVEVPEGFAARLASRQSKGHSRKWWWMLVPVAAALAMVLVMRPAPESLQPVVAVRTQPPTPSPQPPAVTVAVRRAPRAVKPRWRTLTASELASADFPLEILRPIEEKPLKDLEVPELEIKPLAGAEEETVPKEPQR